MKKLYFLGLLLFTTLASNAQVVISQVYGGGGNAGATYTNDFIEIFNRGSVAQDLTGWSVQYASATGTSWAVQPLTGFNLQPGQYFLIQCAAGTTPSTALPTPDSLPVSPATGLAMSGSNGKVLLANVVTAQTGLIPSGTQIMDLVGYGSTPTGYEGTGPTGTALTSSTAVFRNNAGCSDNNNNPTDFTTALPAPRNTVTALSTCSTAPSMLIVSPTEATVFNPTINAVNVTVSVSNFTVANGTGTGHIHYTVDGGATIMKYDTAPIALTGLAAGNHSVVIWLVDNSHANLSPAVTQTVNFSIATFINVADIAAIRTDVIANGYGKYYQLTSNPVVSYKRTARNQKYVQDNSSAILIDDVPGKITTVAVIGDALSGLQGQSFNFSGVLEFLPIANATVASSGNVLTPVVVTTTDINANIDLYESKLCQVNNVTFTTANGTATFTATSADYAINDGGTNSIFRTLFTEADYMTAPNNVIPSGSLGVTCIVSENNGTAKITARNLADFSGLATNQFNEIAGFNMYPNPVSNGKLYISSDNAIEKTVAIYDLIGKQIINQVVTNEVNVSSLNAGIYIVKVTEEGKTATRKLVVQ